MSNDHSVTKLPSFKLVPEKSEYLESPTPNVWVVLEGFREVRIPQRWLADLAAQIREKKCSADFRNWRGLGLSVPVRLQEDFGRRFEDALRLMIRQVRENGCIAFRFISDPGRVGTTND